MNKRLGILMDDIATLNPKKDSSLAMLEEAKRRNYEVFYFKITDLYFENDTVWAELDSHLHGNDELVNLNSLDALLFRTDPPVNDQYLYATYLLELAEKRGLLIINSPVGIRNANEKLFALNFADCIPPTIIAAKKEIIKKFLEQHKDIVVKPLNGMGGRGIFRIKQGDHNFNSILDLSTNNQNTHVMAQKFIPEISAGDKRILLINGEPVEHGLARIPAIDDFRGNLAAGASNKVFKITEEDQKLINKISDQLRENKLYFVGVDIIGNYITEINVTSPTCIREIEAGSDEKITEKLFDFLEQQSINRQ